MFRRFGLAFFGLVTFGASAFSTLADPVPDFSIPDDNPNSTTYQELISPRDYLGQVSAWYFGHSS